MSYRTVAASFTDPALIERISAAVTQEAWNNSALADNEYARNVRLSVGNARLMVYPVAVSDDVAAAYASALAAGNPNPGGDESVITDGMILGSVQADWPQDPA